MSQDPKEPTQYTREFLERLFMQMLLIRRFEEKAAQAYGLRKIGGFLHLYIGQEAVVAGSMATLNLERDYVLTGYRDHGHALVCGISPRSVMAELYGKATGCSRGKGGSMHMFDASRHMLGGNGIVGGHIPLATGVAFKLRYMEEKGVVLCYFGDGAIHQGAFHESLNLARIWNLPIVYICENNQYGMGTYFRRVSAVDDFSVLAASYGMPGRQVDGMNVLTVHEETEKAVQLAREEGIPTLLELKTYRYKGHSMSDPSKYRTKEELETYRKQDPLLILRVEMEQRGLMDDEVYRSRDEETRRIVDDALTFAEESPEPNLDALYEDILA